MRNNFSYHLPLWTVVMLLCLIFGSALQADAFTLKVVDNDGNPVTGYRWLVEEDTTNVVTPGTFSARTLGVNIHTTYAPVKKNGHSNSASATINVSSGKRYLVSVLPDSATDGSPRFTASGKLVETGDDKVPYLPEVVNDMSTRLPVIMLFSKRYVLAIFSLTNHHDIFLPRRGPPRSSPSEDGTLRNRSLQYRLQETVFLLPKCDFA